MIKSHTIILASILKPVDDPRMHIKLGASLAKNFSYNIRIFGQKPAQNNIKAYENITFHPIFRFNRLNIKRFLAPFIFFVNTLKYKPPLLIIQTHELLVSACLCKLLIPKTKIVYDIQENYYANLINAQYYPGLIKYILAYYIRFKEKFLSRFINHFFIAETCYQNELPFINFNYTILENKALKNNPELNKNFNNTIHKTYPVTLLFTGTIAEQTGIFNAINFCIELNKISPVFELKIVGSCMVKSTYNRILDLCKKYTFLKWEGSNTFIAHSLILHEIKNADYGLISYPVYNHLKNKTPTKFYEYVCNRLPIIIQNNNYWNNLCKKYDAGIIIDYENFNPQETFNILETKSFYKNPLSDEIYWENEENKLCNIVKKMLPDKL